MSVQCGWITEELEDLGYRQFLLCSTLFCSLKKAADSKEGESMSSLPLKMNGNTVSQDPTHMSQFPHKHEENASLPKTAGESVGGGCPASTAMEDRLDKVYLEILKKKTTVNHSLLPQGDKTNQVRVCAQAVGC